MLCIGQTRQRLGLVLLIALGLPAWTQAADSRIKDVAAFQGVRGNQLMGQGLVVGLDGTGDSRQTFFTTQMLANMLDREGIQVDPRRLQISNAAAVTVTATLPPFARVGSTIDVTVSSLGDAESLQGGVLLSTTLKAANGQVYAVAQGPVSIGGFAVSTATTSIQKNQPTVGRVPNGAYVEREVGFSLQGRDYLDLVLFEDDFVTAKRVATAVDSMVGQNVAQPIDSRTVRVIVPQRYRPSVVDFISQVETQPVEVDVRAKVVINEKTGTVIFGKEVLISEVTIVHGSLTVEVGTQFAISQPGPLSEGETVVVPNQSVEVTEQRAQPVRIPEGATIAQVIQALNAVGASPRDILAIIQAIKANGGLQADLEII
ncbi:MAG TPA: flagellar basal body P-ring protein FlgI [Acidobacteriota bacterium]|nr:flagellar basal body P-ring protein FlgI [Acidobacteriota bacterium]